jgi:hypothetical protein
MFAIFKHFKKFCRIEWIISNIKNQNSYLLLFYTKYQKSTGVFILIEKQNSYLVLFYTKSWKWFSWKGQIKGIYEMNDDWCWKKVFEFETVWNRVWGLTCDVVLSWCVENTIGVFMKYQSI